MATRKGPEGVQIVSVFSNQGEAGGKYELSVGPDAFAVGTEVIEVFGCTVSKANEAGNVTALMAAGLPKAFFPTGQMEGSGLCGYPENGTTAGDDPAAAKKGAAVASMHELRWLTALFALCGAVVGWLL